jgi:quinol monooxygenase YgiN
MVLIVHAQLGMIVGTVRIPLSPDRRAEVLEVLRSIQGPVLAQPGCAACHIYEEQGPEQSVVLVERWESEAALKAHIRSESYRRVLGAIELSFGPPEVSFDHVSSSEGMELIERSLNLPGKRHEPGSSNKEPKRPADVSRHS